MSKGFLSLVFIWILIIFTFSFLSTYPSHFDYSYEASAIYKQPPSFLWHLANFDGGHYHNIADLSYIKKFQTAFFPLYPLLINATGIITNNHLISSLLISLICFLASLFLLSKFTSSNKPLLLIIFSPLAFFFLTSYTESLFLFLSLASWLSFKNKKYFLTGVLGFFASLTRFYGSLLFPVLVFEYFLTLKKKEKLKIKSYKPVLPLLLIPLGLLTYSVYLYFKFQDPLAFIHSLSLWQKSNIIIPPQTLYRYLKIFLTVSPLIVQYHIAVFEFLSFFLGLIACWLLYKDKNYSFSLYVLLGTLIPSFTGTLQSLPRYLIVLFPLYLLASKINKGFNLVLAISFILQMIFLTYFLTGVFVA